MTYVMYRIIFIVIKKIYICHAIRKKIVIIAQTY